MGLMTHQIVTPEVRGRCTGGRREHSTVFNVAYTTAPPIGPGGGTQRRSLRMLLPKH